MDRLARGWAVIAVRGADAQAKEREAARAARRRAVCGARTRKGTPCRNMSEAGRKRCRFHGGKSTGARTPEGIERIREAQRRRWARVRTAKAEALQQPEGRPAACRRGRMR